MAKTLETRERLERGALILSLLDALRTQSRIPDLGRSLEASVISRELTDLAIKTALAELDEKGAARRPRRARCPQWDFGKE